MKGGIAEGTVNAFNFIFDMSPAGKGTSRAGEGEACPASRATAIETRTLTRKL
jgi:hypothetical protein